MRCVKFILVIIAFLWTLPSLAFAQGAGIEWEVLNKEALKLYRKGDYSRAVLRAQKALEIAEQKVGPDHPDVATSLNNLASLYTYQGDYAKADPFLERSLAISEKALGSDLLHVMESLESLALLYRIMSRLAEAEKFEERAKKIRAVK